MIPHLDLGGSGPLLHFAHANGYPPACYRPLLGRLIEHYHVFAMHQRPLWPDSKPEEINDWCPLTDDFLRFLDEQQSSPLIGVGHSLGGIVTLRAALRQPERFRALVLIDPVLFPPDMLLAFSLIHVLGLEYRLHPLLKNTLNRRRTFADLDILFKGYRRKTIFRYMDDTSLQAYVEGISQYHPDGSFELVYSPEWEARIYVTLGWQDMDIWHRLPNLKVPLLILRGAETNTFWERTAKLARRILPAVKIVTIPKSTHLVPLERPDEVYQVMQTFLQEIP